MREQDRKLMRRRLDVEMRPFRWAARGKRTTGGLLRAVRQSLQIPLGEITDRLGINRSNVFEIEQREEKGNVTLQSMARAAEAMGCVFVYGVVPQEGKTMEALLEQRLWAEILGMPVLNVAEREGVVAAIRQQGLGLGTRG